MIDSHQISYLHVDFIKDILDTKKVFIDAKQKHIETIINNEHISMFDKLKLFEIEQLMDIENGDCMPFFDILLKYRKMMSLGYDSLIRASDIYTTILETDEEREIFYNQIITHRKCFFLMKK